jgi:hypothetical protein
VLLTALLKSTASGRPLGFSTRYPHPTQAVSAGSSEHLRGELAPQVYLWRVAQLLSAVHSRGCDSHRLQWQSLPAAHEYTLPRAALPISKGARVPAEKPLAPPPWRRPCSREESADKRVVGLGVINSRYVHSRLLCIVATPSRRGSARPTLTAKPRSQYRSPEE